MPEQHHATVPYAALNDELDKELIDWRPTKAGERVAGIVTDLTEVDGEHSTYPLIVLDTGTTLARIACSRSVLEREVRGRDVRIGDQLAVQYEGEVATANGQRKYHSYRVVHKPMSRVEPPRVRSVHDDEPPADYLDGSN